MIALLRHSISRLVTSNIRLVRAGHESPLSTPRAGWIQGRLAGVLCLLALVTILSRPVQAQCAPAACDTSTFCNGCSQSTTTTSSYSHAQSLFGQNLVNSPPSNPTPENPSASGRILIPKFNPANGTLQNVQFRFRATIVNETIHVRNNNGSEGCTSGVGGVAATVNLRRSVAVIAYPGSLGVAPPLSTPDFTFNFNSIGNNLAPADCCDEFPFDQLNGPVLPGNQLCPSEPNCRSWIDCPIFTNGPTPAQDNIDKLNHYERASAVQPNLCNLQPVETVADHGDEAGVSRGPVVLDFGCVKVPNTPACLSQWVGAGQNVNLDFLHAAEAQVLNLGACSKIDVLTRALAKFEVEVTYTFCPNFPPVANNDTALICTGSTASIDILANDYDQTAGNPPACTPVPEANGLVCSTVNIVNQPPAGQGSAVVSNCTGNQPCLSCRIVYTPPANFVGTTSFTYRVSDGEGRTSNTATVTVTVCRPTTQNDTVQVCRNSSCSVNVLANDSAGSGCSPIVPGSVVIVNNPTNGTVSAPANGVITYTPNTNYVGPDSFTYRVTDQQGCQSALTTVNVIVCSTPSLIRDNAGICPGTNCLINVLANDTAGSCGQIVTSTLAIATPPAPGSGVTAVVEAGQIRVTVADAAPTGQVIFTYTASYTVCGQACSSTGEVSVCVLPAPSALDDSAFIDPTVQPSVLIPVKNNDTASTGCTLGTPTLVAGSITPAGSGTVVWVPAENAFRFTPTPPATMPGQVSFQYDICQTCPPVEGCNVNCTETCCRRARVTINRVCPTFNRLQPASLLLYPKYDARQGRVSLLTITNTNGNKGGDVDVEFRYIDDKMGCHPTGREHRLTPNDTLTMLASTQVPNGSYGYAYAYAKSETDTTANPTGEPIVFNHLIGQVLILDGAAAADWSVSSVNFKGIGAERAPNDDDNDGIRDLNFEFSSDLLPEYEKAPAELRIPRFIGQQQIDETSVILIALSGGQAFTTTVMVDGYNDNEVASSSQYVFSCWDQPRLTTLFPFAQEAAMRGASDDPLEIIGAPHRESGWFRIQGLVAESDAETIANPAIYAVLVENIANFAAADLPYEYCQRHGDLLPKSPLGDGPNPSANDGQ